MFGRHWHLPHWGSDHAHPARRQAAFALLIALLLATLALLILPPRAHGNFVYWTNGDNPGSVGRAKINGTAPNDSFIPGLANPQGVAVDSQHIYWVETAMNRIGRANLDGTGVIPSFISVPPVTLGIAVNTSGIYWASINPPASIGHADLNGGNQSNTFINPGTPDVCGIAANDSFIYWLDSGSNRIGRAPSSGGAGDDSFVSVPDSQCGLAVDPSYLYWSGGNNEVGRVPIGGGTADAGFVPNATPGSMFNGPAGVAVNSQYVFWSDGGHPSGANLIGRANITGAGPNPALVSGINRPTLMVAAPSNKITVDSITRKKKKGTAIMNAKVPGPGQVTLSQTPGTPDVNATAAAVKQIGLTITQASSFKIAVKPIGKTAKKLNKQIKKQLRKKRKAKAKVKQQVFISFVPAGVAGVPNSQPLTVKLVKTRTKKK